MTIDLKEIETLELAPDNALGFEPGWYAIAPNHAKCWRPFDTVGALGDWLLGRICQEVAKSKMYGGIFVVAFVIAARISDGVYIADVPR